MFHRIDNPESLAAQRFWLLVERLHHYDGAITAAARQHGTEPAAYAESDRLIVIEGQPLTADPDQVAAMQNSPLFGPLGGMAPVFSYSTAPLQPTDGTGDADG